MKKNSSGRNKPGDAHRKLTDEELEECVDMAVQLFLIGYSKQKVKFYLNQRLGMPFCRFDDVCVAAKKRLKEDTDVYTEASLQIAIARLNSLLVQADADCNQKLALEAIKELNKVLGLYEQKVTISVKEYELEL